MATQAKKKEGLWKARKGGGFPELTTKGLIVIGVIAVAALGFTLWSTFLA